VTYTSVLLEVSSFTYDEIACKLRAAGYDHAFGTGPAIDMQGIALTRAGSPTVAMLEVLKEDS
jgi:hypothetical protein